MNTFAIRCDMSGYAIAGWVGFVIGALLVLLWLVLRASGPEPDELRYYEAAYQDGDAIRPFGNGTPDLRAASASCESLNSPNPRKPHPDRVYFVAFQDRPGWRQFHG